MKHRDRPDASAFESGTWTTDSVPCPPDPMLAAHVDGELDAARSKAIETHLDRCSVCNAEATRLEGLSHLLRAWDVAHPEVVPPPRLGSRILREVEVESGVRRRETLASFRRVRMKSIAAGLLIALGAWLGAAGTFSEAPSSDGVDGPRGAEGTVGREFARAEGAILPPRKGRGTFDPPLSFSTGADGSAGLAQLANAQHLADAIAALSRVGEPTDLSLLSDPATTEAFVPWALLAESSKRLGEGFVIVRGGRAIPCSALGAFESVRRWEEWIAGRERRASEPPTRDPSASGTPISKLLPLPSENGTSAFWASLRSVDDAATRRHGGTSLRLLPPLVTATAGAAGAAGTATAVERSDVLDLREAVRSGAVRLLEDLVANPEVVVVQVRDLASPVLVPAGELLSGGIAPRVVAHGAWLPAGSDTYQVKLSCRAVGPVVASTGATPVATGLLAGLALRGALARGESADGIRAIVKAQLRGAALEAVEPASGVIALTDVPSEPDLLRLYALDAAASADLDRRARETASRLGDDAAGFVAVDALDERGASGGRVYESSGRLEAGGRVYESSGRLEAGGRFQGVESVGLAGAARKALLLRLVTGYLAEAGSRSSVDGTRAGVDGRDVLSVLVRRPVRLLPPVRGASILGAEEPRTGVAFETVLDDRGAPVMTSGLLPDVR